MISVSTLSHSNIEFIDYQGTHRNNASYYAYGLPVQGSEVKDCDSNKAKNPQINAEVHNSYFF